MDELPDKLALLYTYSKELRQIPGNVKYNNSGEIKRDVRENSTMQRHKLCSRLSALFIKRLQRHDVKVTSRGRRDFITVDPEPTPNTFGPDRQCLQVRSVDCPQSLIDCL